jgi:4-coumarate--CoA ligase
LPAEVSVSSLTTDPLLDSLEPWAQESTILHAEAALPSNCITKSEARIYTKRLAWIFRHAFSIGIRGPGKDVVVCISSGQILLSNIFYGVIAVGGVFSAASTASTSLELARQVKQGRSNLIVCSEDCKEVAVSAAIECHLGRERVLVLESMGGKRVLRDVVRIGTNFLQGRGDEWIRKKELLEWEPITDRKVLQERVVCLLYSSGTTGMPKGLSSEKFYSLFLMEYDLLTTICRRENLAYEPRLCRADLTISDPGVPQPTTTSQQRL